MQRQSDHRSSLAIQPSGANELGETLSLKKIKVGVIKERHLGATAHLCTYVHTYVHTNKYVPHTPRKRQGGRYPQWGFIQL